MNEIVKQIFEFANLCKQSDYVKVEHEMRSHEKHIYTNNRIVLCEFVILLTNPNPIVTNKILRITFEDIIHRNKVCINIELSEIENEENLKQLLIEKFNDKINEIKTWFI